MRGWVLFFLFCALKLTATTWAPAYPYKQRMGKQDVVIDATSYDPYTASPMQGATKVYYKNKLLYTIDRYYREELYASDDGHYLAVVYTSNTAGITSYTMFGIEKLNFDQTAIEILKDGMPFKKILLKEVIDTTRLLNNGRFFFWGYSFPSERYEAVKWGCDYCKKENSRREMKECMSGVDTSGYGRECKSDCDSVALLDREAKLYYNSVYVVNNRLHILTNQGTVVVLDFSNMQLEKIPLHKLIPDKASFDPPVLTRKYKKIKLPEKFDYPGLKNGKTLEEVLAAYLNLSHTVTSKDTAGLGFYMNITISKKDGRCVESYVSISRYGRDKWAKSEPEPEIEEQVRKWVLLQNFSIELIPTGFDKYRFLCIFDLGPS